ncbi:MAG TPA: recombinase family protein [Terriglobales bacterium]|nr:recombinase family protein [Terriglobales bacterium]
MAIKKRTIRALSAQARPLDQISRVALYARVSTVHDQNPAMHLEELRDYADRRGWRIMEEYVDKGVSGAKASRPALNRLTADACRRRFDAVLVAALFGIWSMR